MLPIGSSALLTPSMFQVLHEVTENLVNRVLEKLRKVVKLEGMPLVMDRVLLRTSSPSEKFTIVAERVCHLAIEYTKNVKLQSLRDTDTHITKMSGHGFEPITTGIVSMGRYLSGREFLSRWDAKTSRLLNEIRDESKRKAMRAYTESEEHRKPMELQLMRSPHSTVQAQVSSAP